jgi:hypothetical protein
MQKDMLQSIDDSALEAVSGGHVGEILAHAAHVASEVRSHVRGHIREAADHVGDAAGKALVHAGHVLEAIGSKLAD